MHQLHESTEGEKIIEYYLEDQGIKFEREVELHNLLNDKLTYRRADFYLPKYKVYLEFLGQWKDLERKQEYIEKMKVYELNEIPCVYIYPDNLGPLDIVLKMRMRDLFEKFPKLYHQSLLFNLWKFQNIFSIGLASCIAFALILIIFDNIREGRLRVELLSIIIPTFSFIYLLIYSAKLIFFQKEKTLLNYS